jgi:hypothetical protein
MSKKLKLSKETLKTISPKALAQVVGASDYYTATGMEYWAPSVTCDV